jgi:hypothetical protein
MYIRVKTVCGLADGYQHFCPEDGGNIFICNVSGLTTYQNTRYYTFEEHTLTLWLCFHGNGVETPQVLT